STARNGVQRGSGKSSAVKSSREPSRSEQYAAGKGLNGTAAKLPSVHCMLAPLEDSSLLLPTQVVAEVIEYQQPEPISQTPDWFLGQIDWENRHIPVFSYAALIKGTAPAEIRNRNRIMVVKSLTESTRVPYLGFLVSDIPKLVTVQPDKLDNTGDENKSLGVFCHVLVDDQPAVIPDLERLTHLVTHVAYGALPITQIDS
ncbi:MAG TPA: chemotaxis protein CheW, partial [Xanthomonadales bacterium]|nr:chemotaxis protein CheW [Xanthomonadales bacterium]